MKRLVQKGFEDLQHVLKDVKLDDRALFFYGASFVITAARMAAKSGVTWAMEGDRMIENRSLNKLFATLGEMAKETTEFLKTEPVGTQPPASDDAGGAGPA